MDKLYSADSTKGYEPLTDEEKEAMSEKEIEKWEEKIKDSILRKDSTLNSVASAMKNVMMHMSTHPRLLKDVLTQYKSTFAALKELINNSIQVIDDGDGIPFSQFHERIMKVATDGKAE